MKQITQIITRLPTPPMSADMESFDPRADAFLPAIVVLGDEVNKWAGQANAVAKDVNKANESAKAAQIAAEFAAGATAWDKKRTYVTGECVYGTDGQTYRALKQSKNKNPVLDMLGYWSRISSAPVCLDAIPGGGLDVGRYRISTPGRYDLPRMPGKNALIECVLDCTPTQTKRIVIARNGLTIEARAEDLIVEDARAKSWVMMYNGETWRVIV